jgi:hypothetical protein
MAFYKPFGFYKSMSMIAEIENGKLPEDQKFAPSLDDTYTVFITSSSDPR